MAAKSGGNPYVYTQMIEAAQSLAQVHHATALGVACDTADWQRTSQKQNLSVQIFT